MRVSSIFLNAAIVMAEKGAGSAPKASTASEPLMTASGVWNFVSKSVYLSKDLTYFLGSSLVGVAWEYVPPQFQGQVADQYEELSSAASSFRVKNGIPAPAQFVSDVQSEYSKKFHPHVEKGINAVYGFTGKIANNDLVQGFFERFEEAYPEHAGSISTEITDLAVLMFVLVFFVLRYLLTAFCFVFCCGCCTKRKAEAPKLQKPVKTSSGKKMR